ncbi:MAG: hypothetical protein H0V85_04560 [Thermoleophilaceae bacterium]|nr:hypothetical protein [Thermoleophilaceae bacterium]
MTGLTRGFRRRLRRAPDKEGAAAARVAGQESPGEEAAAASTKQAAPTRCPSSGS